MRGLPDWRETPVFIWTSMVLTEEEYASLAASANAIVSKGGGALAAMLGRPAPLASESSGAATWRLGVTVEVKAVRTLIVDDNSINSELAVYVLEVAVFAVECVADATEALQRLESNRPDLMLLDI